MARRSLSGDTYGAAQQTIQDWVQRLRSFGSGAVAALADELVGPIESALGEAAEAGRSVTGEAWRPTKSGAPALQNIMSAINVRAIGKSIVVTLTGHHVYHQFGTGWVPRRPLLPTGGMPDRIGNLIRLGYLEMADEWLSRKGRHDTSAAAKGMGKHVKGVSTKGGGKK